MPTPACQEQEAASAPPMAARGVQVGLGLPRSSQGFWVSVSDGLGGQVCLPGQGQAAHCRLSKATPAADRNPQ